jgi:hypothetical protein
MCLSSSRPGIAKIVIVILTVVIVSAAVLVGYYISAYPPSSTCPTPSPSQLQTVSPSPTLKNSNNPATPTPSPASPTNPSPSSTPSFAEQTEQEKVRDSIMTYIKTNHPEAAQFMKDLVWTGGRVTPANLLGAETYMYYSQGWNVTINYPVVPNPIYKIVADYSAIDVGIPYRIIWKGTLQNDFINETSYIFAQ